MKLLAQSPTSVEVREWISNCIPYVIMDAITSPYPGNMYIYIHIYIFIYIYIYTRVCYCATCFTMIVVAAWGSLLHCLELWIIFDLGQKWSFLSHSSISFPCCIWHFASVVQKHSANCHLNTDICVLHSNCHRDQTKSRDTSSVKFQLFLNLWHVMVNIQSGIVIATT